MPEQLASNFTGKWVTNVSGPISMARFSSRYHEWVNPLSRRVCLIFGPMRAISGAFRFFPPPLPGLRRSNAVSYCRSEGQRFIDGALVPRMTASILTGLKGSTK